MATIVPDRIDVDGDL